MKFIIARLHLASCNLKQVIVLLLIISMQFVIIFPIPKANAYSNPATVPLSTVSKFAALAKSAITSPTGPTVLNNGDLGLASPATCTGFPGPDCTASGNGTINNGSIQYQNTAATTGQTDATAAVSNITGRGIADKSIADGLLGGQILTQGVYDVPATTTNLTGDLTLNGDADSVFIFRMESTLITANGSRVVLGTGVQACNVFWRVASSATFDGNTQMVGTVIASESITFSGPGATLNGRVIAQTAAITFNNTTVNNSSCASPTPTPTPTVNPDLPTPTPTVNPDLPTPTPTVDPTATSNSDGSSSTSTTVCSPLNYIAPIIIESKRVDADSIFVSWGPYSGINTFNVQYGFENGKWLYNTNVTGFSTTINDLPPNQQIWVKVAAADYCSVGTYGEAKLVGAPSLPYTGMNPHERSVPWSILIGIFLSVYFVYLTRKGERFPF